MTTIAKQEKKGLTKTIITFVLAIVLVAVALFVPAPAGLSTSGWRAIVILLIAVVFWVSEVIPNLMASVMIMCLVPAFGVLSQNDAFAAAGNNGMFFLLAAWVLAAVVSATKLPALMLRVLLKITKNSSEGLVIGITCIGAVVSMFVANGASTAMTAALAMGILKAVGAKPGESRLGKALMIGAVFGSQCGGVAFPMSNIGNVVGLNLMTTLGYDIKFLDWAIIGFPLACISAVGMGIVLAKWAKPEKISDEHFIAIQEDCKRAKITSVEIKVLIVLAIMMYFWIFTDVNMALVGVGGAILMLMPWMKVTTIEECHKFIQPEGIFLITCVTVVVAAINSEGAGAWFCDLVFKNAANWSVILVVIMIMVVCIIIHAVIPTGAAVVGICIVAMIPLAVNAGFSLTGAALLICWFGSFLPCMPTDAVFHMAAAGNYWTFKDVMKSGGLVTIFQFVSTGIWVPLICAIANLP